MKSAAAPAVTVESSAPQSPLNVRSVTGDVGELMASIEACDPDRVPIAVVSAGPGKFAYIVLAVDAPVIRREVDPRESHSPSGYRIDVSLASRPRPARRAPASSERKRLRKAQEPLRPEPAGADAVELAQAKLEEYVVSILERPSKHSAQERDWAAKMLNQRGAEVRGGRIVSKPA